jgi:hypothetical protein
VVEAVQSTHAWPFEPHAVAAVWPATQSPVVWLQHPPLHGALALQAFVHEWDDGSHA